MGSDSSLATALWLRQRGLSVIPVPPPRLETIATVFTVKRSLIDRLLPRRVRPHHRVETRQECAHARGERDLLGQITLIELGQPVEVVMEVNHVEREYRDG